MSTPKFAGIALGGPMAGQMIEHFRPIFMTKPKVAVLGVKQQTTEYYYVPLMGMQGFWIAENETKGSGPWDDIIRILSEFYVNNQPNETDSS